LKAALILSLVRLASRIGGKVDGVCSFSGLRGLLVRIGHG